MIFPGIDLGSTYSAIGHVNSHGQPALFPDYHDANQFRTPSVIFLGEEGCLVGAPAEELEQEDPTVAVQRYVKLRLGEEEMAMVDHLGRAWSPEALSALILRKLRRDAMSFVTEDLGPAVVTVPAQFTDAQRRATRHAAMLAGLGRVTLIEEPVAAAVYYGQREHAERTLLVYDLGGGTFDATLLHASPESLDVLSTDGVSQLGGKNVDELLANHFVELFEQQNGASPLADPAAQRRLRSLGEEAKIRLGKPGRDRFSRSIMVAGRPLEATLSRAHFQRLISPLVSRTIEACERCLGSGGLGWSEIDAVLVAGGSSMLPQVSEKLALASQLPPHSIVSRNPHQAVAFGAAIMAQRLAQSGGWGSAGVSQVAGADLGLRVWDRKLGRPDFEPLIARNSAIPCSVNRTFYTHRDDQTRLVLEFVQRRGEDGSESSLGHFSFGPIEEPRKNFPVEVTAGYAPDGTVHVTARDGQSGREIRRVLDESNRDAPQWITQQQALVDSISIND